MPENMLMSLKQLWNSFKTVSAALFQFYFKCATGFTIGPIAPEILNTTVGSGRQLFLVRCCAYMQYDWSIRHVVEWLHQRKAGFVAVVWHFKRSGSHRRHIDWHRFRSRGSINCTGDIRSVPARIRTRCWLVISQLAGISAVYFNYNYHANRPITKQSRST